MLSAPIHSKCLSNSAEDISVHDLLNKRRRKTYRCTKNLLLIRGFNSISVLACDYLDSLGVDYFVRLHLKCRVLYYERPYIVAESVRVQVTLADSGKGLDVPESRNKYAL
jgi:hypothetical protein